MAEFPNTYSTSPVLNAASTAPVPFALPFLPKYLRIYNASAFDLYADYTGTAATTGSSHIIKTLTDQTFNPVPVPIGALSLTTTTTAAAGARVSVVALGRVDPS